MEEILYLNLKQKFPFFTFSIKNGKLIIAKFPNLVRIGIDFSELDKKKVYFSAIVYPVAYVIFPDLDTQLSNLKTEVKNFLKSREIIFYDVFQAHL
ncbi:MAG TPA: hypothetical protein PKC76_08620 [Saprospiraceae bacterium]|nr:hypothetical protein [Saprospiraceae bacterium]HMP24181.1 hypothetical protein [Saprospiraceae bacterium]